MTLRWVLPAALLGAEVLAASLAFDGASLPATAGGPLALLRASGAWLMRWAVASALVFAFLVWLRRSAPATGVFQPAWLAAHVAAAAGFFGVSRALYGGVWTTGTAVLMWGALGAATAATAACLALAPAVWRAWLWQSRRLLALAAGAGALACAAGIAARLLWQPAAALTFQLVKFQLACLTSDMILQPERLRLGTQRFTVIISPECSGLEGMGLFLVFGLLWLLVFRDELRFPQAWLLIPLGLLASYLLNAGRIFALLLIGHAGFKDIAIRGFHSQAGWIAFCAIAFGLLLGARRLPWFSRHATTAVAPEEGYPAAPYLVPFMALMAAGILAQALTAHFEWFYPLRVVAAAAALWMFRRPYRSLDFRFGWDALAAGAAVFVLWIATDPTPVSAQSGPPPEFTGAALPVQIAWIAARLFGAVFTVPVAEELAFRGFGLRRLVAESFEDVRWNQWTWPALLISSIAFGLLHGAFWPAGMAAGAAYAAVAIRRNRIGEAIGAHAMTNALLAGYVLVTGSWHLW